ncbi:MAG: hypothetical protein HYZ20_15155, partial [Burkholderiales bacterium]|nr:hypothetical protein [Burkholderiales bacterium]
RLAQRAIAASSRRIDAAARALPERAQRLQRALVVRLQAERQRLLAAERRLHALDPRAVLARGYAWVEDSAGTPVTQAAALAVGQAVTGVWADGRAALRVEEAPGGRTREIPPRPPAGTLPAA